MKSTIEIEVEVEGKVRGDNEVEITGVWLERPGSRRINIMNHTSMETDARLALDFYKSKSGTMPPESNIAMGLAVLGNKLQHESRDVAICVSTLALILMTKDEDCFYATKRAMLLQTRRAVQRWAAPENANEDWAAVKEQAIERTQEYIDEESDNV